MQGTVIALGFPPERGDRFLLLMTSHSMVTGHG